MDPMNRRISIIVMNKKTEKAVLESAGNNSIEPSNVSEPAASELPTATVTDNAVPALPTTQLAQPAASNENPSAPTSETSSTHSK